MGLPRQVTYSIGAANATALINAAASGTTTFTLATTVVGTNQQRLILTVTGNESSNTFTIVGTNQAGYRIVDTLTGPNASTTQSNLDFVTVTSVRAASNTVGTTSLGPNSVGSTMWFITNYNADPCNVSLSGILVSGAVNWGAQYTYDDPNNLPSGVSFPSVFTHPSLNGQTGSADGASNDPVVAVRFIINSGTGTLRGTVVEAGLASP